MNGCCAMAGAQGFCKKQVCNGWCKNTRQLFRLRQMLAVLRGTDQDSKFLPSPALFYTLLPGAIPKLCAEYREWLHFTFEA